MSIFCRFRFVVIWNNYAVFLDFFLLPWKRLIIYNINFYIILIFLNKTFLQTRNKKKYFCGKVFFLTKCRPNYSISKFNNNIWMSHDPTQECIKYIVIQTKTIQSVAVAYIEMQEGQTYVIKKKRNTEKY